MLAVVSMLLEKKKLKRLGLGILELGNVQSPSLSLSQNRRTCKPCQTLLVLGKFRDFPRAAKNQSLVFAVLPAESCVLTAYFSEVNIQNHAHGNFSAVFSRRSTGVR